MRTRTLSLPLIALLAIAGTACTTSSSGGGDAKDGEPTAVTVTAADAADGSFAYTVSERIRGGAVTLTLVNEGEAPHDFQLLAAVDGHTLEELVEDVSDPTAAFAEWLRPAGGVGVIEGGTSRVATVDLRPGTYWYVCTQSSEVGGKDVAHAPAGMAGELEVEGDNAVPLPITDGIFTTDEYSIEGAGLTGGLNQVTFKNEGRFPHHVVTAAMTEGSTLEDVEKFMASQGQAGGPPPVDFATLTNLPVIDGGQTMIAEIELEAGRSYALVCFMPDPGKSEPPHTALGMIGTATVE